MSASFQAVPQPYPLYAAVVMVRKHPDEPWDHNAWTALVIGWHHYRDPDGSPLPAAPLLADSHSGRLPAEFVLVPMRTAAEYIFFAPTEEEALFLAESFGAQQAATWNRTNRSSVPVPRAAPAVKQTDPFAG